VKKLNPVECGLPIRDILIGSWWWSENRRSCIKFETRWWRWDWSSWRISRSR